VKSTIAEIDQEPVVHYSMDHQREYDMIYVDGPFNELANSLPDEQKGVAFRLDSEGRLANADVELFWRNGIYPRLVVVDRRKSTVRRLVRVMGDKYNVFLSWHYIYRGTPSRPADNCLYHTVFMRR
jgi:hypothetical protein